MSSISTCESRRKVNTWRLRSHRTRDRPTHLCTQRQRGDRESGAGGRVGRETLAVDLVHSRKVADCGQPARGRPMLGASDARCTPPARDSQDGGFHHVRPRAASRSEHRLQVLHHLLRLLFDAVAHQLHCLRKYVRRLHAARSRWRKAVVRRTCGFRPMLPDAYSMPLHLIAYWCIGSSHHE